ncbi:phage minor tail protein L [Herbaspirillum seropedicae]|uniref:phage minor tail protein L n=1 Tax=Herbaspirillum seropedicae TaxID=964 RepID=UPI0028653AC4|nr:phage minor tail protein L [Herbaspirillum seropedicae]MDR6394625.1 lambda family phage minor tail protein L [Herbaspirillum seropedicae]
MSITADIQKLEVGAKVELFELDATEISGDVLLFHGYQQLGVIVWQGREYAAWPIQAEGFSKSTDGQPATPKLRVGNIDGTIGAACLYLDDFVGAKVTRFTTLGKYLDAVNFPEGNPDADPDEQFPPEIWYVEQKTSQTAEVIEFELSSPLDFDGLKLPARKIIANLCPWDYRGPECGWTGITFFNTRDEPVADRSLDRCGKRLSSCKCRFGQFEELPYGGFPAADLIRAN